MMESEFVDKFVKEFKIENTVQRGIRKSCRNLICFRSS